MKKIGSDKKGLSRLSNSAELLEEVIQSDINKEQHIDVGVRAEAAEM